MNFEMVFHPALCIALVLVIGIVIGIVSTIVVMIKENRALEEELDVKNKLINKSNGKQ
jgi:preprotein translocase subunit SecF